MRISFVIFCLLLVGCSGQQAFTALSSAPYDPLQCVSTSYGPGGYNTGLRIIAVNAKGDELPASVTWSSSIGTSGSSAENFTCFEEINDTSTTLQIFSKGYAPSRVEYVPQQNKLATIQVTLHASGTIPGSCREFTNNPGADALVSEAVKTAGIEEPFTVSYSECNLGRGGYVKAKGEKDGKAFSLYYRHGWCSSGGTDCGYSLCLATADAVQMQKTKDLFCPKLSSRVSADGLCAGPAEETSNATQQNCQDGAFQEEQNGLLVIALNQQSNRCSSNVTVGNFDCMQS